MGKKNKNAPPAKKIAMVGSKRPAEQKQEKARGKIKNKTLIIASAAAVLVCALTAFLIIFLLGSDSFNYLKSDLSEYITLSADEYKNYTLNIKFDEVTDSDVDRKIMNLLYQNRAKEGSNKQAEEKTVPVSVGDKALIYYRGYTTDESGRETDIGGASNMTGSYYELEIGSLSFIKGFEEGLIGAVPANHIYNPQDHLLKEGSVSSGDVIYLSYSVILPDGTSAVKKSERIDLSNDGIDAFYGVGFKEYFASSNITIGNKISGEKTFQYGDGTAVYFDMKVEYAIRCPSAPITVEACFPADYHEKSLRGVNVRFDVYFKATVVYEVPEYNEEFITETLKIKEEDLREYEGASLIEKHRAYLLEGLISENQSEREALIEEAVWDYYNGIVDIKSLPLSEVESVYEEIYAEIYNEYVSYYSSKYPSIESYIIVRYGAPENSNAKELMSAEAEQIVTEKLIFYYIIRKENLLPSADEYKKAYEKIYSEHLNYYVEEIYADVISELETEEEKQEKIKEIEREMTEYFGEEYFAELVYYDYAYDKIISFATIVEK